MTTKEPMKKKTRCHQLILARNYFSTVKSKEKSLGGGGERVSVSLDQAQTTHSPTTDPFLLLAMTNRHSRRHAHARTCALGMNAGAGWEEE